MKNWPWSLRLLTVSILALIVGGTVTAVGLNAAFTKPSPPWSNTVSSFGISLLAAAPLLLIVTSVCTILEIARGRRMMWWQGVILLFAFLDIAVTAMLIQD